MSEIVPTPTPMPPTLMGRPTMPDPVEMINKVLTSEIGKAFTEQDEKFKDYVKSALADIYKTVARVEAKLNLISGHVVHNTNN